MPLRDLTPAEQYEALFGEICEYLGITEADVAAYSLKPNTDTPLFINTIGAWTNRPEVRAENIANLYFAGDWVRNQVDLACMEGAVCSAIDCARAVAESFGVGTISPPQGRAEVARVADAGVKWAVAPRWCRCSCLPSSGRGSGDGRRLQVGQGYGGDAGAGRESGVLWQARTSGQSGVDG